MTTWPGFKELPLDYSKTPSVEPGIADAELRPRAFTYLALASLGNSDDQVLFRSHLPLMSFANRAVSLHVGAISAARTANAHAAFTLLRASLELVGLTLYAIDQPDYLAALERPMSELPKHMRKIVRRDPWPRGTEHAGHPEGPRGSLRDGPFRIDCPVPSVAASLRGLLEGGAVADVATSLDGCLGARLRYGHRRGMVLTRLLTQFGCHQMASGGMSWCHPRTRRGDRVVECGGLENRRASRLVGSNPTPSATSASRARGTVIFTGSRLGSGAADRLGVRFVVG